jgi:hypothetical protein
MQPTESRWWRAATATIMVRIPITPAKTWMTSLYFCVVDMAGWYEIKVGRDCAGKVKKVAGLE